MYAHIDAYRKLSLAFSEFKRSIRKKKKNRVSSKSMSDILNPRNPVRTLLRSRVKI